MAPFQHDNIGVLPAGLDVLLVHGLYGGQVLGDDAFQGPVPLFDVPEDPPQDAGICIGIHKDLNVHLFPKLRVLEDQDPLGNDHLGGADLHRFIGAVVDGIIVDGAANRLPGLEAPQVLHHHRRVKGIGVVVIQLGPFLIGELVVAFVVVVMIDDADLFPEVLLDLSGNGGLAAAGPPGDADDHGPACCFAHIFYLPLI